MDAKQLAQALSDYSEDFTMLKNFLVSIESQITDVDKREELTGLVEHCHERADVLKVHAKHVSKW